MGTVTLRNDQYEGLAAALKSAIAACERHFLTRPYQGYVDGKIQTFGQDNAKISNLILVDAANTMIVHQDPDANTWHTGEAFHCFVKERPVIVNGVLPGRL